MVARATVNGTQVMERWPFWQSGAEGAAFGWLQVIANHSEKSSASKFPFGKGTKCISFDY